MKNVFKKFFFSSNNLDYIKQDIRTFSKKSPVEKIFNSINLYSSESEIRYVGGFVRKIINKEKIDDIDLATNLDPVEVCRVLEENQIEYYKTGIDHGTITAIIDEYKFEITSLREDVLTDGRHAKVKFSKDWKEDAARRDFTINAIYSDMNGNLFDPFDGKGDLDKGLVNFIGDAEKRIKEDYLRILRYIRFFLNYSKHQHSPEIIRKLKINIGGISNLSKERLLDELKKMLNLEILEKLSKDKIILNIISLIFPELKNIQIFFKLSEEKRKFLKDNDFIFLLSLMIIDETDNADYFLYKYNISKKDLKRIQIINNFYKEKVDTKSFSENRMNKIFYYRGKQAVIDIVNFKIVKSKKIDKTLVKLIQHFKDKDLPLMPIGANILMSKYKIPEGKQIGVKLKLIEEEWVKNNFQISDQEIDNIIKN
jgi:tRNA nucleotidyltransferase/poly(A) polymerase